MSEYEKVLHKWAERFVPAGARVLEVRVDYSDGYDWTYGGYDPSFSIDVKYEHEGRITWGYGAAGDALTLGEVLTELFAIAERV